MKITIKQGDETQELRISDTGLEGLDTILVVGPGYYGYGVSIKAAKDACIKAGCPRKARMLAYMGDDTLGVTDFGEVRSLVMVELGEV